VFVPSANAKSPQIQVPGNLPIGNYTVRVQISNPECDAVTWDTVIRVSQPPQVLLNPIPDYCAGASITPDVEYLIPLDFIDSVRWFFPGATMPDPPTSNQFIPGTVTYASISTYEMCVVVYNLCGTDTACQTFRILEPLLADAVLDADSSCSVPFTTGVQNNSTGDDQNYWWTVTGPGPVTFTPNVAEPTFVFTVAGTYVMKLTLFNTVCDSVFWMDTVTILLPPTVTLTDYTEFCESVCLLPMPTYSTGTMPVDSVFWTFPGGMPASSTVLNPPCVQYEEGAGTYTYTVTAFNVCGSATASDTFVIDTIPEVNLGPPDTICLSDGVTQLFPPTPPGGVWSGPGIINPTVGLFNPAAITLTGPLTTVTVTYTFTDGICVISKDKTVLVIDMGFVDAGPDVNACISDTAIVLNGGIPAGGWYVGPGVTDSVGIFSPSSLPQGAYVVTYYYQLPFTDCIGSDTFTVYVRPLPVPNFTVTDSLCVNVAATYTNTSTGATKYVWLFDDGATYTTANVSHAFTTTGLHTVQLIAETQYGCRDSIEKQVYVSGPPDASFAMDTTQGCAVLPINFTNTSVGYQFVQYAWDFGNNTTSTLENPGTQYYQQGLKETLYFITLTATNHCGTDTYRDSVLVYPKPLAELKLSKNEGCTPLTVRFNNLTQGLPDSFAWYVNDMLFFTDTLPPDRVFTADGVDNEIYIIKLIAFNECGTDTAMQQITVKPDSIRVFFSVDPNTGCEPLTVTFDNSTSPDSLIVYNWYFDQNDDTSTAEDTSYAFYATGDTITQYTVTLVANNGCSENSYSTDITVYPAPKVSFTAPDYVCAEDSVQFINTSIDVNGNFWDFGDGDTSNATNPIHHYALPGTYLVKLTAYSAATGCPNTFMRTINIRELPAPIVSANPLFGCPPLNVNLVNQTANPGNYFYRWDFGDGNTAVGANPGTHTYYNSGDYKITLWAVDVFGCDNDTVFSSVLVYPVPVADCEIVQDEPCGLPQEVCFQNTSTGASGFEWNLGNGETSLLNNPCTSYDAAGTYTIQIIAKNAFLCTDVMVKTFTAYDVPKAMFEIEDTVGCVVEHVFFKNTSLNAEYARWTFHNGTDTTYSPTWIYPETGYYGVKLVVGNGSGCEDSIQIDSLLHIYPSPTADFYFDKVDADPPSTYQFTDDSSLDALYFFWDFGDASAISEEKDPKHRYLSSFDKTVYHWVVNQFGCADTATAVVDLDTLGALYVPNILEPANNTHPEKQIFLPKGIGLADFYIAIYARTGQLIWESTSLDGEGMPNEFWDGTFLGEQMPGSVYVWKVHRARFIDGTDWDGMEDEQGKLRKSGYLYLVR
jgi:PKD repeat protein